MIGDGQAQDFPQNPGVTRQFETYVNGVMGQMPVVPMDYDELELKAREVMSDAAYAYVAGGAGREDTIFSNEAGFARWALWPRMLRDVSVRDAKIELFGKSLPAPLLIAPIGVQSLAHEDADLATAKAAAATGVPMIFSNQASVPMEDCAAVMGDTPRFFQLYWGKDPDFVASLVSRAEKCGCSGIVVTLDTTILGWRTRDLDLAYLPFIHGDGIAQYTSDPVFRAGLDKAPEEDIQPAVQKFLTTYSNPALTWEDLKFLRKHTSLPILLKGILHPEDAKLALEYGVDGLVVSNHGGRQVDGSVSAIEALPHIAKAVDRKIPILIDSGVRGGADMVKALALGATAVCLGRPYIYGLALAGQAGVEAVIKNTLADFDLTMGLIGCKSVSEIGPEALMDRG